jgi:hypothetical protein
LLHMLILDLHVNRPTHFELRGCHLAWLLDGDLVPNMMEANIIGQWLLNGEVLAGNLCVVRCYKGFTEV